MYRKCKHPNMRDIISPERCPENAVIYDYEVADRKQILTTAVEVTALYDKKLSDVFAEACVVGSKWYISPKEKNTWICIGHNMMHFVDSFFRDLNIPFSAEQPSVKESKPIGKRANMVKITHKDVLDLPLAYIEFETAECDVYKKLSTSSGKGLMITNIKITTPHPNGSEISFRDLLDVCGLTYQVVSTRLFKDAKKQMSNIEWEWRCVNMDCSAVLDEEIEIQQTCYNEINNLYKTMYIPKSITYRKYDETLDSIS